MTGNAGTPADEADVKIQRLASPTCGASRDLADYTGQLQVRQTLRITDKLSGSVPIDPATVLDLPSP